MPSSNNRVTLPQSSHNHATIGGTKENFMKTTARHSFRLAAVLGLVALVVTGMRCNGFTPGEPATPPKFQVPTYTHKRIVETVEWPASSTINQTALKAMKPEEAAKIANSGVPVLVPSDPRYLAAGIMLTNEFSYDFALDDYIDGANFTLGASRVSDQSNAPVPAYALEPDPNAVVIRGQRVSFSQNEMGNWLATWGEFGQVGYLLHVGCETFDNPRCADDTFIKSLVASLVYVGGNGK